MGKSCLVHPSLLHKHHSTFPVSNTEHGLGIHFLNKTFSFSSLHCCNFSYTTVVGSASIVAREQWRNKPNPRLVLFKCHFLFSKSILAMFLKNISVSGKWLGGVKRELGWNPCSTPTQAGKPCLSSFPKPCLVQRKLHYLLGENSRTCHHSSSSCFWPTNWLKSLSCVNTISIPSWHVT